MAYNRKLVQTGITRPCKKCGDEDELNEDGLCRACFFAPPGDTQAN